MDTARGLGLRIAALRKRRGLTQKQLADGIGRTKEAISSLECGRNMPSVETLQRTAVALGVEARDLLAPAGGGAAENPKHAALFSELIATARTLPLADLERAVKIVGVLTGPQRGRGAA